MPTLIRHLGAFGLLLLSCSCSRSAPTAPKDAGSSVTRPSVATRTEVQIPPSSAPDAQAPTPGTAAPHPDSGKTNEATDPRTACQACNGEWKRHGVMQEETCNCRTRDAGKPCRDGRECEGQCLADNPKREVTSKGPPQLGYFVGRCSEFIATFGCHAMIQHGAADAGPVRLDIPPRALCMD